MNDNPSHQNPNPATFRAVDWGNSKSLLEYTASQPVFFHAGSGCDWNPIARFSDVCRVFVFCSETEYHPKFRPSALEDCPSSLRTLFGQESCGSLDGDVLRQGANLQTFRQGHWSRVERTIEVKSGGGGNADTLYKAERRLFLAFLQADPVEVFQKLFVAKGIGPMFVCLHQTQWEGRFCHSLLEAGAARPRYLVGKWPEIYAPWTLLWQKYRSWGDTAVFQRRDAPVLPVREPVPYPNLHWVIRRLTPEHAHGADAVHLTTEDYLAHRWPDHIQTIFLDVSDAGFRAGPGANEPRLSPLLLSGLPMQAALTKLAEACKKADIHNLHTGRFGFEDESDPLRSVWPTQCCRWVLTVHCETRHEIRSLQGFECNDLPAPARPINGG